MTEAQEVKETLKGMAIAKAKAQECAMAGGSVGDCPYKSKGWVSAWLSSFERAKQMDMFDAKTKQ